MSIALLVADDHPRVRAGIRRAFACSGFDVIEEAATMAEVLVKATDARIDVLLLDVSWVNGAKTMSGETGIELLRQIRSTRCDLAILMYSTEDTPHCVARCRDLGADGYLIKGVDDGLLAAAVRAVHAGGQIWPRTGLG
jgi:DNA-binding NarL/FixJ family response regulator